MVRSVFSGLLRLFFMVFSKSIYFSFEIVGEELFEGDWKWFEGGLRWLEYGLRCLIGLETGHFGLDTKFLWLMPGIGWFYLYSGG